MKKHLIRWIAMLLVTAVFSSLSLTAYAATGISNSIKSGSGSSSSPHVTTGKNLFFSASNARDVVQPNAGDYYYSPFSMYVKAPKQHSVYTYDSWDGEEDSRIGTTFHGGRVTVLAAHGNCSCILFHKENYQLNVAWVTTSNLSYSYPGETIDLGWKSYGYTYNAGDPELKWSDDTFIGTKTRYSILKTPVSNCVGFTLDYQVISRNGASTADVLGLRDIYVNDGSGWTFVGSFDLKKLNSCHIIVTLDEPMEIRAVASLSKCYSDDFSFRQSVLDVMCT